MATSLDKDVIRESSVKIDEREVIVTLSSNQDIKMKLKGMKSGEVKISIADLYNQLTGKANEPEEVVAPEKKSLSVVREDKKDPDSPMINLHDLRSLNAISGLDLGTIVKFDGILAELIKNDKERKASLKKTK